MKRNRDGHPLLLIFGILIFLGIGCNMPDFGSSTKNVNVNTTAAQKEDRTGSDISDLCRNAYYPVGPDVERKYRITYTKNLFPAADYTETYTDFDGDKFLALTDLAEVSTKVNWKCTAEGLFATQYNNSVDMKNGTSAKLDTLESSGVSFLAESRWNTDEKWNADYKVKQTMRNPGGEVTGGSDGTIKQAGEVIGSEEITVPAGTFQTVKVKISTVIDLTVRVAGITAPAKMSLETTAWFAKDTGMVKSITGLGEGTSATTELLSAKK